MAISKQEFSGYIKSFNFRALFNVMGWDNDRGSQSITVDDQTFVLERVAEKRGFKILICHPVSGSTDALIPDYNTRKRIETKITRLFQEHLIIFADNRKQEQIWQLVVRQTGKPTKVTETRFVVTQDPELLYQRASGLFFSLDEEENITIVDVTQRVDANFHQNADRVTKQFYDRFKREHTAFLAFIEGIDERLNKEWYASLMLNRLMFCYFIQKKGFLDNNRNYLRDKLNACRERRGQDQFYSFYRDFLLVLFHEGLNSLSHSPELRQEIGRIPYLNGGLFDEHEIEQNHHIDIRDQAFEGLFDFFDQYEWHLDTRINATGREVNPDVIGYIFEKYINDRAQMGAYYTKEDITEYISKNCIIPYLFDETQRQYPTAFGQDGEIWGCLRNSGDNYIYDAVKYGVDPADIWGDLPEEVFDGLDPDQPDLVQKRRAWNRPAPPEMALPTEIYREVIERRKRYVDIREKIGTGEINKINDFITYNLNIRQFAQDVIENTNDPDFLRHFYKTIASVTILDPTCGSGAFLFAAMNILEPLYEACIRRMRAFVQDEDRHNEANRQAFSNHFRYFRDVLAETQNGHHPNLEYFIFKSIILNNLYGVDIMKEAVEIAKLRLFLKLVATVDADYRKPNLGLEPLPDIDFNIRSGNTLVGIATVSEFKNLFQGTIEHKKGKVSYLDFDNTEEIIEEKCEVVAKAFKCYKEIQLTYGDDFKEYKKAKEGLNTRLNELNHELNQLLHKQASNLKYGNWIQTHQPFHWFAEFYEIVQENGGFDIIIGNPPYVVYTSASFSYKLKDYETLSCANLYAYCSERSFKIMQPQGRFGMIIPNSSISADKLSPLQKIFTKEKMSWISNYAWRPAKLFEGANMLLAIVLSVKNHEKIVRSSIYYKWYNDFRSVLFETISYNDVSQILQIGTIPKIPSNISYGIIQKLKKKSGRKRLIDFFRNQPTKHSFFYFRAVLYWVKILVEEPVFREDGVQTTTGEMKPVFVDNEELKYTLISILSSSLFFVHYITWSSCQVINSRDFELPFDFNALSPDEKSKLEKLGKKLQQDLQENSSVQTRNYSARSRSYIMEKQYFYIKKSKSIIDEIDKVLAKHYGFSEEELDFIINYDIKYRMGSELEGEE